MFLFYIMLCAIVAPAAAVGKLGMSLLTLVGCFERHEFTCWDMRRAVCMSLRTETEGRALIDPCTSPSLLHVFLCSLIVGGVGPCLSQRKHFETADLNRALWLSLTGLEAFLLMHFQNQHLFTEGVGEGGKLFYLFIFFWVVCCSMSRFCLHFIEGKWQ